MLNVEVTRRVYLKDGSAQIPLYAATLRKFHINICISRTDLLRSLCVPPH